MPDLGQRGEGWVAIQTVLIVAVMAAAGLTGADWSGPARVATVIVGLVLVAAGVFMFVRGALDLGRGFSIWMAPVAPRIVETGIYGRVRHPICGGQVLIAFGVGLAAASLLTLGLACVYAALVAAKIHHEETMIERRLPAYRNYRSGVRWRWFPGVF